MRACFSLFRLKTAEGFQYRIAGIVGAFTSIFWVLIEIVVYRAFYSYGENSLAGMSVSLSIRQVITYSWLNQLFFLMQPMSIDDDIIQKINNGDVGIELCRPLDLYFHWFSKTAASKLSPMLWRGSVCVLVGSLMPMSFRLSPPTSILGFCLMIISLVCALFLCTAFCMFCCSIRLSISWGDGPTYILMLIGGVMSGAYLPLQLWPDFMQRFLVLQPFASYLDIPLRLYIGTIEPHNALPFILIQLFWVLFFVAAGKWIMVTRLKSIVLQGG